MICPATFDMRMIAAVQRIDSADPERFPDRRQFRLRLFEVEGLRADARPTRLRRGGAHRPRVRARRKRPPALRSSSPLQCRTISSPASKMALARSSNGPPNAFIDTSSLMIRPSKPISPRMISWTTMCEVVAGRYRIERAEDDMRAHRHRQVPQFREGSEIARPAPSRVASTTGKLVVAVGPRPAMAGHMLDDRERRRPREAPRRKPWPWPRRRWVAAKRPGSRSQRGSPAPRHRAPARNPR